VYKEPTVIVRNRMSEVQMAWVYFLAARQVEIA
jgi:hypothetical protein